jgi:hypothetical protein
MEIYPTRDVLLNYLRGSCGLKRRSVRAKKVLAIAWTWVKSQQLSEGATMNDATFLPAVGLETQSLDVATPGHYPFSKLQA